MFGWAVRWFDLRERVKRPKFLLSVLVGTGVLEGIRNFYCDNILTYCDNIQNFKAAAIKKE